MIYIDHDQNPDDTIRIFIPIRKANSKSTGNIDTIAVQNIKPARL